MITNFEEEYKSLLFGKFSNLLYVKIKPNSKLTKVNGISNLSDGYQVPFALSIDLKEKPENNKANKALIKFFSKKFNLHVLINSGQNSRLKVLEIVK